MRFRSLESISHRLINRVVSRSRHRFILLLWMSLLSVASPGLRTLLVITCDQIDWFSLLNLINGRISSSLFKSSIWFKLHWWNQIICLLLLQNCWARSGLKTHYWMSFSLNTPFLTWFCLLFSVRIFWINHWLSLVYNWRSINMFGYRTITFIKFMMMALLLIMFDVSKVNHLFRLILLFLVGVIFANFWSVSNLAFDDFSILNDEALKMFKRSFISIVLIVVKCIYINFS